MMATSGLVSRIHACDFSNPKNTRFQYGSSVLPLSSAAPMAGTCDEPIHAMIFATAHFRFAEDLDFGFDFDLDFDFELAFDLAFDAEAAFDADFAPALALAADLSLPELLRLPSTERPPPSIMAA